GAGGTPPSPLGGGRRAAAQAQRPLARVGRCHGGPDAAHPPTIAFVSTYVRQQVRQLDLTQPASYAMHAHLIPSYYLDRVAATKTIREGQALQKLAERIRTPLFAPE